MLLLLLPLLGYVSLFVCLTGAAPSAEQASSTSDVAAGASLTDEQLQHPSSPGSDGSRWAVLLSSSRYWHNYRHASNALSFNHLLHTTGGIPDERILLFLADCPACNPRNALPATISNNHKRQVNLYGTSPIDFAGYDVTVRQFLPTLRGQLRHGARWEATPWTRRLRSDATSHVLVYLTGHGGDGFLKFHDSDYLYTEDLLQAAQWMHRWRRFGRLLVVVETCHAESLCLGLDAVPNVACVASSAVDKESFSHHADPEIGVDVIDFFSYSVLEALLQNAASTPISTNRGSGTGRCDRNGAWQSLTLHSVFSSIPYAVVVDRQRLLHAWRVADFFCVEVSS